MSDNYVQRLEFSVDSLPADLFTVFRMSGREAISELFRFEIDLVSDDPDLVLESLAGRNAALTVTRLQTSRTIHGMIESIEAVTATPHSQYVYRAVLVPRLQRLAASRQNQIHGTAVAVSVREVLADELTGNALRGAAAASVSGRLGLNDFELRLTHTYPMRDYVVQYDESDLDFVSRLCEHYGIFYFFAHESGRDVAVFGDSRVAFPHIPGSAGIAYRPASGLANATEASIFEFGGKVHVVAERVCLRDFNYRLPTVTLEVDETVDPDGHGVVVEYGAHFRTPEEGRALARVRAEQLLSRKRVFEGAGDDVRLTAGAVFELTNHYRRDFSAGYLVTWIEHEATQALPGIAEFAGPRHQTSYRNRFECLPQDVEFRPARRTPRPRMTGLSNAMVDASGSGQRAEIDASGRYKIRQQFDQRGEAAGQSSRYMRKTEPYGGANTGMHFPLLKGTEVILACVNGDPDRPIIVGAMQNEQYPSIVNSRNSTTNRMRTTSGTLFEIDDGPASNSGGGTGAGTGAALAPQRALEGLPPGESPKRRTGRSLDPQRAEADVQTSGGSSSSYARLQITAGTDSYWRLGSEPSDSTEDTRTPGMSDMTGGDGAGGAGFFQYTAGDSSSLIDGSSYAQVGGNCLDYVVGSRRQSAATHNTTSLGEYQVIGGGISIESSDATLTDGSAPTDAADPGDIVITASGHLTENIYGNSSQSTGGDSSAITKGSDVSQTWGSTAEFMMGSAVSMTFGFEFTMNLSMSMEFVVGTKLEVFVGFAYEFRVGPAFEFSTSPAIEFSSVADLKTALTSIDQKSAAWVAAGPLRLFNHIAEVRQAALQAKTGAAQVNSTTVQVSGP